MICAHNDSKLSEKYLQKSIPIILRGLESNQKTGDNKTRMFSCQQNISYKGWKWDIKRVTSSPDSVDPAPVLIGELISADCHSHVASLLTESAWNPQHSVSSGSFEVIDDSRHALYPTFPTSFEGKSLVSSSANNTSTPSGSTNAIFR